MKEARDKHGAMQMKIKVISPDILFIEHIVRARRSGQVTLSYWRKTVEKARSKIRDTRKEERRLEDAPWIGACKISERQGIANCSQIGIDKERLRENDHGYSTKGKSKN